MLESFHCSLLNKSCCWTNCCFSYFLFVVWREATHTSVNTVKFQWRRRVGGRSERIWKDVEQDACCTNSAEHQSSASPPHTMAGYDFDIDVIDTLLKPSVITHPYISPSVSTVQAAQPGEQLGVSECGWSSRGGREREGERGRISLALKFPQKKPRGKDERKREWVRISVERERERVKSREQALGLHLSSRCGLHSCLKQEKRF